MNNLNTSSFKIGDQVWGLLGTLSFSGKIIMIAGDVEVVELPCGLIIRTEIAHTYETTALCSP